MHRNRTIWWAAVLAIVASMNGQDYGKSARAVPKFEVDPSWPKIPNGWVLGQVASAAADERDNIWVLHRPRVVRPDQKTGPPVMEFDSKEIGIRAWKSR